MTLFRLVSNGAVDYIFNQLVLSFQRGNFLTLL